MVQAVKTLSDGRRPEIAILVAALVIMAVCCALPFVLPREPAGVVLLVGVLGTQLLAYTAYFRLYMYDQNREEGARWREPRPIYAITVAGALFALPTTLTGAVDLDTPGMPDLVLLLLAGAITVLLGRLGAVLVWMPVKLLIRGAVKVARAERGASIYFLGAGGGLVLVGFGVSGALAVDTSSNYSRGAQIEMVAALFGSPGDYTVVNPELLVVARVFGAIMLLVLLMGFAAGVVAFVRRILTGLRRPMASATASAGEGGADRGTGADGLGSGEGPRVEGGADGEGRSVESEPRSEGRSEGSGQGWTGKLY